MTANSSTCDVAFVSSFARSLVYLPNCFEDLKDHVEEVSCSGKDLLSGAIIIGNELLQSLPEEKSLSDVMLDTTKLQHKCPIIKSEK